MFVLRDILIQWIATKASWSSARGESKLSGIIIFKWTVGNSKTYMATKQRDVFKRSGLRT